MLQGAPAAGEQRESSFAQAAQGTEQRIAGAGIDIQFRRSAPAREAAYPSLPSGADLKVDRVIPTAAGASILEATTP